MHPAQEVSSGLVPYRPPMTALNFSFLSRLAIYTPQVPQYNPQGAINSLFLNSSSLQPSIISPCFLENDQNLLLPVIDEAVKNKIVMAKKKAQI